MAKLCIFEDEGYKNLLPINYLRCNFELRCGMTSLLAKILKNYKDIEIHLWCRDYLKEFTKEKFNFAKVNEKIEGDCLFVNGRVILDKKIPIEGEEEIGISNDEVIFFRLKKEKVSKISPGVINKETIKRLKDTLKLKEVDFRIIKYRWNLIDFNAEEIIREFKELNKGGEFDIPEGVFVVDKKNVYISKTARIKPGVVIDAEEGPVYIDDDVLIEGNAFIQGPAFIGRKSIIRPGAKIREATSIGEVCRVGGEVEESIIHGYSNKQHDGFLGHAYVCMWCNLGAGTNNSDLKNNYGTVKVWVNGEFIDSGSRFVGLTMADHSKSSIGTTFNTGTVVGVSANIFGEGFPPKFVPSFSWGGAKGFVEYNLEKAINTAKIVMSRRKVEMSKIEEEVLRKVFEMTKEERKHFK